MSSEERDVIIFCEDNPESPERNYVEVKEWQGVVYCTDNECPKECCEIRKVVEQT
jgi:hypothetical protein